MKRIQYKTFMSFFELLISCFTFYFYGFADLRYWNWTLCILEKNYKLRYQLDFWPRNYFKWFSSKIVNKNVILIFAVFLTPLPEDIEKNTKKIMIRILKHTINLSTKIQKLCSFNDNMKIFWDITFRSDSGPNELNVYIFGYINTKTKSEDSNCP